MQSHEAVAHVHSPSSSLDGPATPPPSSAAAMSIPADRSRLQVEGRAPTRARYCCASSSETSAERLTDDLILEILPRVPAKSLCCFRCVSKHWLGLIDHPDHRKRLPQTLAGFFYARTFNRTHMEPFLKPPIIITRVSGSPCPLMSSTSLSLAFLPNHTRLDVLDCCNGLLLCRLYDVSTQKWPNGYNVVCNPATEKWVALPQTGLDTSYVLMTRLGFDPTHSSHFHVFELLMDRNGWDPPIGIAGVAVYSSEAGRWIHKMEGWNNQHTRFAYPDRELVVEAVFLNGHLYFHALGGSGLSKCLAAVDTEGETWTNFAVPGDGLIEGFIQQSQGRLHYANFYRDEEDNAVVRLAVYVLESYESKEWILKHSVETSCLFEEIDYLPIYSYFKWVGIHPESNLIFFIAGRDNMFMCYNMDRRQVKLLCILKDDTLSPFLPYVPLYRELQPLHV